jgi:hypothetical protein
VWNMGAISCFDLSPVSKIAHYIHANIPKSETT